MGSTSVFIQVTSFIPSVQIHMDWLTGLAVAISAKFIILKATIHPFTITTKRVRFQVFISRLHEHLRFLD